MRLLRPNTTYRVDGSRQVEVSQSAAAVLQKALKQFQTIVFLQASGKIQSVAGGMREVATTVLA